MGAEVAALGGGAGDREEIGGFPAVDAEEGEGEAEVAGLFTNQGGFGVITGDEDAVGTRGFDGGELGTEIFFALAVFLLGGDHGAGRGEAFAEIFSETDALSGGDRGEDGDAFQSEGVAGELGHDGALKIVDEADAEDVVPLGGDLDVGGAGRDEGDLSGLGDGGGFEGAAGGDFAEDDDDLVARDQFFDYGGGLTGFRLVVFGDEFEGAPEDAAGGVGLLDGETGPFVNVLAEDGFLAGHRGEFAEFDGVWLSIAAGRSQQGGGRNEDAGDELDERPGGGNHRVAERKNVRGDKARPSRFSTNLFPLRA